VFSINAHILTFPDSENEVRILENRLARAAELIVKIPANTGVFFDCALRLAGFRLFLNHSEQLLISTLKLARDLGQGLFVRGNHGVDTLVEFKVNDELVSVKGGSSQYNTAMRWQSAFGVGLILRDDSVLNSLCEYNPENFEGDYDSYHNTLVRGIIALYKKQRDAVTIIEHAHREAEHACLFPEVGARIGAPLALLVRAVYMQDSEHINQIMASALEGYKLIHTRQNENHRAEAYIPYLHLGLSAMAHDLKMPLDIESEYLPPGLVSNNVLKPL